jgi:hypothetical protein
MLEPRRTAAKVDIDVVDTVGVDYNKALMAGDRQAALVTYHMTDLNDLAKVGEGCPLEELSLRPLLHFKLVVERLCSIRMKCTSIQCRGRSSCRSTIHDEQYIRPPWHSRQRYNAFLDLHV